MQLPNGDIVGIANGQYWRLVSAMFLHAGLLHIAFNAYALWIFGSVVEQELGRVRFLLIYFVDRDRRERQPRTRSVRTTRSAWVRPGRSSGSSARSSTYNYRRRHLAIAAARLRGAVTLVVINMVLAFSIQGIDWRAHVGGFIAGLVAGFAAEGVGSAANRRLILIAGFAGLLVVAVGLVAWRTSALHSQFTF